MTTKDGTLGFGDLVKRIRNEGDNDNTSNNTFPNVDAFINDEDIQLSPEIRDVWPITPTIDNVKLENVKSIFEKNDDVNNDEKNMEEKLKTVQIFLNETKQIPDMLERAKESLSSIEGTQQKLSQLVASVENGMPK